MKAKEMADMRQIGFFGLHQSNKIQRFLQIKMGFMFLVPQSINNQNFYAF